MYFPPQNLEHSKLCLNFHLTDCTTYARAPKHAENSTPPTSKTPPHCKVLVETADGSLTEPMRTKSTQMSCYSLDSMPAQ